MTEAKNLVRAMVSIPLKMDNMLGKMSRGEIAIQTPDVSRRMKHLENNLRQINRSIVFAVLFIGGIQLYLAHAYPFGELLLAFSILGFLWSWISGWRS
jgi:hypothetical protein